MSTKTVSIFKIRTPKEISYQVTPGNDVILLRASLFRAEGEEEKELKKWNSGHLKNGVKFTADENADRFVIVLQATVKADTTLKTLTTFDPKPPDDDPEDVKIKAAEGIAERLWVFRTKKKKEA